MAVQFIVLLSQQTEAAEKTGDAEGRCEGMEEDDVDVEEDGVGDGREVNEGRDEEEGSGDADGRLECGAEGVEDG